MQALRKTRPEPGIDLIDVPPPPPPGPGEVLIQVAATGVCGTDLHIDAWVPSYHFMQGQLPVTLGHEFSGHIAALGAGVQGLAIGQLVAVRPSTVCERCAACLAGNFDACVTRRGIGVGRDGAFAEQVVVPARNCLPIPEGVSAEVASLAEPLSVSHEAVRVGGVQPGDRVLVLGPGNIGQGIALFAREAGASQVVIAGQDDAPRFAVLREMGFTELLDVAGSSLDVGLQPWLADGPFDVVIEATGAGAVIAPALAALKPRGVLVITGIHARPVPIDLAALVRRHQELRGSYRAPEANWPLVIAFMRQHQDELARMVTHRVSLTEAEAGFAEAHSRRATKVVVVPTPAQVPVPTPVH